MSKLNILYAAAAAALLSACTQTPAADKTAVIPAETAVYEPMEIVDPGMFSKRDLNYEYAQENCIPIKLNGDSAECADENVTINGGNITITEEGVFFLSGELSDGSIIIDAKDTDKIQLVFSGAAVTSQSHAALYVKQADKVFVTTAEGTDNLLANGGKFIQKDAGNVDGAVFARDDITFNGSGRLTVNSPEGHGIVCNDELTVSGGEYEIKAGRHGLKAKDGILICASAIDITAGKDGIRAAAESEDKGLIYIDSGVLAVNAAGDGISADSTLTAASGSFDIHSTGAKAIKTSGNIEIRGGAFSLHSADDGIHSDSDIVISGGSISVSTEDDGIHADNAVTVSGGSINVAESYEGIEGKSLHISGGAIAINASDDGLNAAGGYDGSGFNGPGGTENFAGGPDGYSISVTDGTICINASGDGIDSNGTLSISGGTLFISACERGDNSAIDYESSGVISGGTLAAAGSIQMAENFSNESTQCCVLVSTESQRGGSVIELKDSSGNVLINYIPEKDYQCVLISLPELELNTKYTLTAGEFSIELELSSVISSIGPGTEAVMQGNRGPGGPDGGGRPDDRGQMPGERDPMPPDIPPEMPSGKPGERPQPPERPQNAIT